MTMLYELWDVATANLVAVFDTEAEALASVRRTLDEHGRAAVVTLALGATDEDGGGEQLAAGDELISRAYQQLASA